MYRADFHDSYPEQFLSETLNRKFEAFCVQAFGSAIQLAKVES
jgi:hypothetical protein